MRNRTGGKPNFYSNISYLRPFLRFSRNGRHSRNSCHNSGKQKLRPLKTHTIPHRSGCLLLWKTRSEPIDRAYSSRCHVLPSRQHQKAPGIPEQAIATQSSIRFRSECASPPGKSRGIRRPCPRKIFRTHILHRPWRHRTYKERRIRKIPHSHRCTTSCP